MAAPRPAPAAAPRPRRPSRAARRRRRSRRVTRVLLVGVLAMLVGTGTFVSGLLAAPIDFAVPPPPKSAVLLAADGTQLATIRPPTRREIVPADQIPEVMRQAIISAEDERFLEHKGVDVLAIGRAAYRDLTGGRQQGGSTLTQQYVKNVYIQVDGQAAEKTLLRKVKEGALAVRLEKEKTKEEILTDYLNVLFLGNGTYGVQAASKYYFGVPITDLDLDERTGRRVPALGLARGAMLAGIAPAPSVWNPVKDFATARQRQIYTLNRMVTNGYTSSQKATEAFRQDVTPLKETPPELPSIAPEYTDLVRQQIIEEPRFQGEAGEALFFQSGLRVKTTLDVDLQTAVARAVREVLPDATDPQAAVVAVDINNGDVKALTTLRRAPERVFSATGQTERKAVTGYERNGYNLADDAYRSTGSTIKPFTLAVALQKGRSLSDRVSAPARDSIRNPGGEPNPYVYFNAAGESGRSRTTTLRAALYNSINTVFVPLAIDVGRSDIKDLMLKSGVKVADPADFTTGQLSFGLGTTAEVTPLSMAAAYTGLVNKGVAAKPRFYTEVRTGAEGTDEGNPIEVAGTKPVRTRVLPEPIAEQVADAMSQVVEVGTAPRAKQAFPVYAKTGTTNDSKDVWFMGCARAPHNICLATWMGYDYKECTGSVTGKDKVKRAVRVVGGSCGGLKNLHGVEQVYGGTLPAQIFTRTFQILEEVKAARAAAAASPAVTSSASASATAKATSTPRKRRSPSPSAVVVATTAPAPSVRPSRSPSPRPSATIGSPRPSASSPPPIVTTGPPSTGPPEPPPP